MRDTRRSGDEQLDRSAAGNEAPPSSTSQQHPQGPPGASAPGDDGRAGAATQADAHAEQPAAPDADESALQGDVDELVAVAAQRDESLPLAQRPKAAFGTSRKRVAASRSPRRSAAWSSSRMSCCLRWTTSTARWP